jgi:PAS domain S-box-containing protein
MQLSFTGVVYFPFGAALGIIAARYFIDWRVTRSRDDLCYFHNFLWLALVCWSATLAGTVLSDPEGIRLIVVLSTPLLTVSNACLAYIFVRHRFPRVSPWSGFALVASLGLLTTIWAALSNLQPALEPSGGVNWGMTMPVAYLRSTVYLLGMGPLTLHLVGELRRSEDRALITRNLFLVVFFCLSLALVVFDFIIEPITGIKALYSEVVILILAVLGGIIYFYLYELVLSRSRRKFHRLVQNMHDMVCLADTRGVIHYVNHSQDSFLGYENGALVGKRFLDLVHPEDRAMARTRLRFNEPSTETEGVEFRLLHADDHPVWIETHGVFQLETSVPDDDPAATAIVCRDITERRTLEKSLRQSQKMQAIGLLAGGVAHDFNNLLTVINGYAESILQDVEPDGNTAESAAEIWRAGKRAAGLTRQLLAFSRKQILQPEVININSLVLNMDKMIGLVIGETIELQLQLDRRLRNVLADPGQIEQVILNLVINARDAMPDGGRLLIETENVHFNQARAGGGHEPLDDRYVLLTVSDTGKGMDRETRERIFEPFFSTKAVGEGTGLGLSTVYGIVKQSQGHISVHSEEGMGTTLRVYLPVVDRTVESETSDQEFVDPRGDEAILVVEDDPAVRALIVKELTGLGYEVTDAGSGSEALRLMDEHRGRFELMVADVVLAEMSGRELAELFREFCPRAGVLFMSGFTDDAVVRSGVHGDSIDFIQKPFSHRDLARQIRDILDRG